MTIAFSPETPIFLNRTTIFTFFGTFIIVSDPKHSVRGAPANTGRRLTRRERSYLMDRNMLPRLALLLAVTVAWGVGPAVSLLPQDPGTSPGQRVTIDPNGLTSSGSQRVTIDPDGLTSSGSQRVTIDPDGRV